MPAHPPKPSLTALAFRPETQRDDAATRVKTPLYPASASFPLLLLTTCYLPILLIWCGIISFAYRFHVLAALLCTFVLYGLYRGHGLGELGFTWRHSRSSIRANALFCTAGGLGLYLVYRYQ